MMTRPQAKYHHHFETLANAGSLTRRLPRERTCPIGTRTSLSDQTEPCGTLAKTLYARQTSWAQPRGRAEANGHNLSTSIIQRTDLPQESHTLANGLRYPLVGLPAQAGGTRQRHFDGTRLEPRNLPENAASPTSRVHAVLGCL